MSKAELHENPLVPNKKLREMYIAMAEVRVLDEHLAKLQSGLKPRRKLDSTRGQEACRVSTAIDLAPSDLISDSRPGVVMELLTGTRADSLLRHATEITSGIKKSQPKKSHAAGRLLPWIEDAGDGLKLALGAALAFKAFQQSNVVLAYVRKSEITKAVWRQVLELASNLELSIIFVVLPEPAKKKGNPEASLSAKARVYGVPGIAVDASDAIALYRVAQESLGRTRRGGGPVLIECMAYLTEKGRSQKPVDPLVQMKGFLLGRKVCTEAWLENAGNKLRRQIEAVKL